MRKFLLELPTQIETERLYLRCYQAGDGPWYYRMSQANKEHLRRYESENAVMSIQTEEDAEVVMRSFAAAWISRDCFFLGAFERETDEFVAQIYIGPLHWDPPEFTIGYFVDQEHEGRGFVTEAVKASIKFIFDHLGAHRISLETDENNLLSIRVAERCGFVKEGHIRQNKKNPDGRFSGTLWYGILRSEFASPDGQGS